MTYWNIASLSVSPGVRVTRSYAETDVVSSSTASYAARVSAWRLPQAPAPIAANAMDAAAIPTRFQLPNAVHQPVSAAAT